MTKEQKEIEEMAKLLCSKSHSCDVCDFENKPCGHQETAQILYTAGYRKADEVRTETAKELAKKLLACGQESEYGEVYPHDIKNIVKELYGVEVEE